MGGGLRSFRRLIHDASGIVFDLLQCGGEPKGIAANLRTISVSLVFAGSADGHLHDSSCHGCQEHGGQNTDEAKRIVAVAPEEEREIGQHPNGTGKRRSDGHGQCVAVLDVRQFMRHDGGHLFLCQSIKQPRAGGDSGVLRAAAGGKCVGLVGVQNKDLWHRQIRVGCQLFHHRNQCWRGLVGHFAGIVHAQHHIARIPPGEHVHCGSNHQGKQHSALSSQQKTNQHEQHGHDRQQYGCFHNIHLLWLRKSQGGEFPIQMGFLRLLVNHQGKSGESGDK